MFKFFQKKENPSTLCNRARSLIAEGKVQQALDALNTAIRVDADYAQAYADRGIIYAMVHEKESAKKDLYRALQLGYHCSSIFVTLATLEGESGNYIIALNNFEKAIEMDPDNPLIQYNRANVHIAIKNTAKSIADLVHCPAILILLLFSTSSCCSVLGLPEDNPFRIRGVAPEEQGKQCSIRMVYKNRTIRTPVLIAGRFEVVYFLSFCENNYTIQAECDRKILFSKEITVPGDHNGSYDIGTIGP